MLGTETTKLPVTVRHIPATLSGWLVRYTIFDMNETQFSKAVNIPTLISFGSNLGGISWMALDDQ